SSFAVQSLEKGSTTWWDHTWPGNKSQSQLRGWKRKLQQVWMLQTLKLTQT
ncbi:hypothetical protein HGM15179_017040, partial [Zosterops borbonicus]